MLHNFPSGAFILNPSNPNGPNLYPLEISENLRFSDIFKGYRNGASALGRLMTTIFAMKRTIHFQLAFNILLLKRVSCFNLTFRLFRISTFCRNFFKKHGKAVVFSRFKRDFWIILNFSNNFGMLFLMIFYKADQFQKTFTENVNSKHK